MIILQIIKVLDWHIRVMICFRCVNKFPNLHHYPSLLESPAAAT